MAIKQLIFNLIQGMNRDISPSKRTSKLAYEIKNMRITIEEDGSLMSWTNEKGNTQMLLHTPKGEEFNGTILGTCVLNLYLVVFTKNQTTGKDSIYRFEFTDNSQDVKVRLLYSGFLSFELSESIDSIAVYENEKVQKVYWVDGINQARVINIYSELNGELEVFPYIQEHNDTLFDFLPLDTSTPKVTITKQYETGRLMSGTIQYAFTFYNLYGAQTNLFYISPIQYVSTLDIGTETDKSVNCAFSIKVENINSNKFNFLRIYSISRTSTDTAPSANIVTDIDITNLNTVVYVDRGESNTSIDYNSLLFMNNSSIRPSTLEQKDNTLFLGNYKYTGVLDLDIKKLIKEKGVDLISKIEFVEDIIESNDSNLYYPYTNLLKRAANEILGFKGGETYFFGFMLLDNYDRWSSIIPIGSKENNKYPSVTKNNSNNKWETRGIKVKFNTIVLLLYTWFPTYKAVKFVIVSTTESQRNVLCLGVVCPTVYSYEERYAGTIPFAQSSWFFRPIMKKNPNLYNNSSAKYLLNSFNRYDGLILEFRHYAELPGIGKTGDNNTAVEIQMNDNNRYEDYPILTSLKLTDSEKTAKNRFGVDLSIVTFHSPEIEFSETIKEILDRSNEYNFKIKGHTVVQNTVSDYIVEAEKTSFMEVEKNKYIYSTILSLNKAKNVYNAEVPAAGLVSPWGVKTIEKNLDLEGDKQTGWYSYCRVFPWNRSTSLNEQPYKRDEYIDWTVPLKTKVMSNLRVCIKTDLTHNNELPIGQVNVCTPTTKLVKVNGLDYESTNEISYYGNIDTVLTKDSYTGYRWLKNPDWESPLYKSMERLPTHMNMKDENKENKMSDLIRMKYTSSSHAVFGFQRTSSGYVALPYLSDSTKFPTSSILKPCWILPLSTSSDGVTETTTYIKVKIYYNDEYWNFGPPLSNSTSLEDYFFNSLCPDWNIVGYDREKWYLEVIPTEFENPSKGEFKIVLLLRSTSRSSTLTEWDYKDWVLFKIERALDDKITVTNYFSQAGMLNMYWVDSSTGNIYHKGSLDSKMKKITKTTDTSESPSSGAFTVAQSSYSTSDDGIFFIGELYRKNPYVYETSEYALLNYTWQAASDTIPLSSTGNILGYGDTYFQRYDCLKTYPSNSSDPNQIIDIGSFVLETRINIDGRYDRNRGLLSNINVNEKNFNLLNKAYTLNDKFVLAYLTDKLFNVTEFPSSITWTKTKTFGEDIDSWTQLTSTSILDLDGDKGAISKILNYNDLLLCFLKSGISQILYNERSAIATSGLPIELATSGKVEGKRYITKLIGCLNKGAITIGSNGVYFIDLTTKALHLFNLEGIKNLSEGSFTSLLNSLDLKESKVFYNKKNKDVYFINYKQNNIPAPALTYNELVEQFISFYDYNSKFFNNVGDKCISLTPSNIWEQNTGEYNTFYGTTLTNDAFHITILANGEDAMYDKIWNNLEFRADSWNKSTLLNTTFTTLKVENEYLNASVALTNPLNSNNVPINRNTKLAILRKKFRIWRALIPRDNNGRNRIRNPWTYIKLLMDNPNTNKTTLHDMVVYYFD